METILYIDVIFLIQGAMHCFLLYTSSKLSGYTYKNIYLLLFGSFVASIIHIIWILFFFPKNGGFLLSFITITIAILIAFLPKTISQYTSILISSIISSFLLGGGLNVVFMIGKIEQLIGEGLNIKLIVFPWYYLIWGTSVAYILIKKGEKWIENHITNRKNFCSVLIKRGDKEIGAYLLIDTGNGLVYEGQKVIIIEFSVLLSLFNEYECERILQGDREFLTPFSFNSLGNKEGILWGFKSDKCTVFIGGEKCIYTDFWIGIQFDVFSDGFDGIAPIDIIKK